MFCENVQQTTQLLVYYQPDYRGFADTNDPLSALCRQDRRPSAKLARTFPTSPGHFSIQTNFWYLRAGYRPVPSGTILVCFLFHSWLDHTCITVSLLAVTPELLFRPLVYNYYYMTYKLFSVAGIKKNYYFRHSRSVLRKRLKFWAKQKIRHKNHFKTELSSNNLIQSDIICDISRKDNPVGLRT